MYRENRQKSDSHIERLARHCLLSFYAFLVVASFGLLISIAIISTAVASTGRRKEFSQPGLSAFPTPPREPVDPDDWPRSHPPKVQTSSVTPTPTPIPTPLPPQAVSDLINANDFEYPWSILDEDTVFYIRNKSNYRCMAIDRSDRYNRANAITVDCTTLDENYCDIRSRQWKFDLVNGVIGSGYMMHPQISTLCGDMYAASPLIGTRFQQFACDPSKSNQRFYVRFIKQYDSQSWYVIQPKYSDGCLQATGGPTDPVELNNCYLTDERVLWTLIPIDREPLWKSCPARHPSNPTDSNLIGVVGIALSPNSVRLGGSVTITVTLNRVTPTAMPIALGLESNGAEATIVEPKPIRVIIPAGSRGGSFTFRTQRVSSYATRIIFYYQFGFERPAAELKLSP